MTVFVRWTISEKLAKDQLQYFGEKFQYKFQGTVNTYVVGLPTSWSIAAEMSLILTCFFIFDLVVRLAQPAEIQNQSNKDKVSGKSTKVNQSKSPKGIGKEVTMPKSDKNLEEIKKSKSPN